MLVQDPDCHILLSGCATCSPHPAELEHIPSNTRLTLTSSTTGCKLCRLILPLPAIRMHLLWTSRSPNLYMQSCRRLRQVQPCHCCQQSPPPAELTTHPL